jgi:hypothetical protein
LDKRSSTLRGQLIDPDNVIADCIHHDFAHGVQLQLMHEVGAMSLCRLHAAPECDRYFFCSFAFCDQLQDFALSVGQRRQTGGACGGEVIIEDVLHARGEERAMTFESLYRGDQVLCSVLLEYEATGSCAKHLANQLLGITHGQDQNTLVWIVTQDLSSRVQPIQRRHTDVEDDQIWAKRLRHFDRLASIARFPSDFPASVIL